MKIKSITKVDPVIMYDITLEHTPVYKIEGVYVHNSGDDLGAALKAINITTGETTIKGGQKTNKNLLNKIDHPIIKMLIDRKSIKTQVDTFISKFTEVSKGRIQYNVLRTDTGRLSSGTGDKKGDKKRNTYFLPLNGQNLTKPKVAFYECEYTGDFVNDIHGYKFTHVTDDSKVFQEIRDPNKKYVEGYSPVMNVRNAIKCPDPSFCLCIDPNTLVTLENNKQVPLSFLENNPQKIKTPEGYHLAKNYTKTGSKQKCILKLKSGRQVICSPDHKFKVKTLEGSFVWKPLKSILPSDIILEDTL